jgi:hypothetical protein
MPRALPHHQYRNLLPCPSWTLTDLRVAATPLTVAIIPPPQSLSQPLMPTAPAIPARKKHKPIPILQEAAFAATHTNYNDHFALHGDEFNPDTDCIANYYELAKCSKGSQWRDSCADEFGRLADGHQTMLSGTKTIVFIPHTAVPKGKVPTYARVIAAYRPEKDNPQRVRISVGGDCILYPGDASTKTAGLTTVELLLNSVISTPGAKFMTGDLKDFYLGTPLPEYKYMRIPVKLIPESIMIHYDLAKLVHNSFVIVEIRRGMYGLPQAGRLANDQLVKFLQPHGYAPCKFTHKLWKHDTRKIYFTLVVDDFGVK